MPGAVLGALTTTAMSRAWFDLLFGLLLVLVAIFLTICPGKKAAARVAQADVQARTVKDLSRASLLLGIVLSTVFGFISSFLGIGGGFLYVPALVYLLHFPVHIATATSLFVLTITALTGSATHIAAGSISPRHPPRYRAFDRRHPGRTSSREIVPTHPRRLDHSQSRPRIGASRMPSHRRVIVVRKGLSVRVIAISTGGTPATSFSSEPCAAVFLSNG